MTVDELYLVDGSAYIYRAYHAIKPLSNSAGLPTHAVFGFAAMLRRLLREKNPQYLAVVFDTKGPVFRHRIYSQYKANRPPMPDDLVVQVPYIRQLVAAYNITALEHQDMEADDLIASCVKTMSSQEVRVVIVSGDKDLLQLVSGDVTMWDPMNDRLMDEKGVEKKYGIGPELLLDYFALTGDSSDNIPGVPGVGPKTAQKLISQYRSLEKLYDSVAELKPSKMTSRILENKKEAYLSRDLIRLKQNVEVPSTIEAFKIRSSDPEALRGLLTELEFFSLLKEDVPAAKVDVEGFVLVQSKETLLTMAEQLQAASLLVVDTETDSLNPRLAQLVGISLCVDESRAWYIPCGHRDEAGQLVPHQLELNDIIEVLQPLLQNPQIGIIGHNLKFDLAILEAEHNGRVGVTGPLYDTMVGAWLLDPGRRSYKLDDLCGEIDLAMTSFAQVVGGDKRDDAFCRVELEAAKNYSCEDVYGALLLFKEQEARLQESGLWQVFGDVEGPMIRVLAAMEDAGVGVDAEMLEALGREFAEALTQYERDIYGLAGHEFNINSPKQLGVVLFEELELPKGRKTKTGWSTDVKVLERLSQHHDLPAEILKYRNLAKLKSTYVDKLVLLAGGQTGRVHSSFNQCGTATGRLSSSNPNLQNIPIRTEEGRRIRSAFVAADGCQLLSGDYSQIDLRVLAHYSKDPTLMEAFHSGKDIHSQIAAEIFFVSPALVTSEMRRVAKTINFGIIYGISSFGLASQLNIGRKEAQAFIDRYFSRFSGIQCFMESCVERARQDGYVTTLLGRRRQLPELNSANRVRREAAERTAINTPIQGTAADIIKLAMLRVHEELQVENLHSRLILQIHDELVLEVPIQELEQVSQLLRRCMENAVELKVPLVVNLEHGQNLGKNG